MAKRFSVCRLSVPCITLIIAECANLVGHVIHPHGCQGELPLSNWTTFEGKK